VIALPGVIMVLAASNLMTWFYVIVLPGVIMVLAASCEFDKRLNSEIVERPSDNEEIPEVIDDRNCSLVAQSCGNALLMINKVTQQATNVKSALQVLFSKWVEYSV